MIIILGRVKMKKDKGFNLISTIIIIIVTAIISGITTGVIMYNSYRHTTGLTYNEITTDPALQEFLEVYSSILNDYYEDVDKEKMLEEAVSSMMNYLGDSYTTYLSEEETKSLAEKLAGEYRGIGISIQDNIIVDVTKESPAEKAGLQINDHILKINKEDVTNYAASKIASMIKDSKANSVEIVVLREEKEITFNIDLSLLYVPAISAEILEEKNQKIGYIYIGTFSNTLSKQIEEKLVEFEAAGISSLIIDVRDNAGGYLTAASDVANLFLKKGSNIYTLESKDSKEVYQDDSEKHLEYKTVVLINKNSASASEILAAALKESYGATLIGETSFGKGKVQQTKTLADGSMVKYTSAKWLTPNGSCIDGIGLNPDVYIENEYIYQDETQEVIVDIIDHQLPRAIEYITQ